MYNTFISKEHMAVKHEIKSQLAKLLATEDLVVEHKQVETACFNVHTRVLTLPMWEKASNVVYDMLVGHEVGHALYTPDSNWIADRKISPQFVNIVEDVRIEKLMKRRYAGISKTFYRGYEELHTDDFFCIEGEDVNKMNLADKINLYFKIGNFIDIQFNNFDESRIVKRIRDCETFDDVLDAAEELYNYCKVEQENTNQVVSDSNTSNEETEQSSQSSSQDSENSQPDDVEEGREWFTDDDPEEREPKESDPAHLDVPSYQNDEPTVSTMDSLEESLKDLIDMNAMESVYVELPKVDLSRIIVPNKDIHTRCTETWNEYLEAVKENGGDLYNTLETFAYTDEEYVKFKRSANKEVNYLVKEFECRKSADSYARATTSRTGVLDTSKLHTYRYNEDLFKKVTTLADGKNHGLVFVLDWSGSMGDVILDTVKQLYNLIWFCKKVNIPFEVYAFTCEYPVLRPAGNDGYLISAYEKKDGLVQIPEYFSMMNLLTSKVKAKELDEQMRNIFRIARFFGSYVSSKVIPMGMGLSGTPLNEAIVCLHEIIPQFKKENKLQKVQCVILTDGEAPPVKYHKTVQRHWESEPYLGVRSLNLLCRLRNRKTGKTYTFNEEWWNCTNTFLRDIRDTMPDVNFIGIRVLAPRDAGSFIRMYHQVYTPEHANLTSQWKKSKSFTIKSSGYHSYFGLSSNALAQNSEFDVKDDATKTQIKSAFVKSLRTKKMNKKILSEFIELVA